MMFDWGEYEGRLAGHWRLDSFLGERDHRAFYVGQSEVLNTTALLQLVEQSNPNASALRASWDRASKLRHPHLLRVFETGDADFDGDRAVYAVMDLPDDDVGEILEKRPVEPAEARAIAAGAAEALAYLHERRLAHGAVRCANMFLTKGNVILSADTVAPALEVDKRRDMRELGASLVRAITGAADAGTLDDPVTRQRLADFGPPFREMADGCLSGEWTPADVLEALAGRPAPPRTLAPAPPAERTRRRWPLAAAATVAAVALLTYATRSRSHEAAAAPPEKKVEIVREPLLDKPAPAKPAPEKSAREKPSPKRTEPVRALAPTENARASEPAMEAQRQVTPPQGTGPWAVIAATYNNFSDAARRAEEMRRKYPQLQPHVFPPENEGRRYYVVLGSGLTQEAAEQLRRRARRLGAPRDTYVTKLADS